MRCLRAPPSAGAPVAPALLSAALALAAPVGAKLWGWPDDFSLALHMHGRPPFTIPNYDIQICTGWGAFCEPARCRAAQQLRTSGNNPKDTAGWRWMQVRMEGAAWADLWRAAGDTFDMFESGADGRAHGQCQLTAREKDGLPEHHECPGDEHYYAIVHCWQW